MMATSTLLWCRPPIALRSCYAISSTDSAYGTTRYLPPANDTEDDFSSIPGSDPLRPMCPLRNV